MLENDRLIKAAFGEPLDRTPVWIMRQAGRYLPEYRALRNKVKDFLTLCKTPDLASDITLQPIQRYPLDAAIIFSDILTIPDAYGLGLHFVEGEGPHFQNPIRSEKAIKQLPTLDPETELRYVMEAIRLAKEKLAHRVPLIGFAGSPWTLATYMIEGKSSKTFTEIKRFLYQQPALLQDLLHHLSDSVIDYLNAQIAAGVDAVMIFDTWGGLLSREHYLTYSLAYMKKIIQGLNLQPLLNEQSFPNKSKPKIPVILFSKNSGLHLNDISDSGCHVISLDSCATLQAARQRVGNKVALQGNLDPCALFGNRATIRSEVANVLQNFGQGSGHIFNLGHGILPDTPLESVDTMIEAIHEFSPAYHLTPTHEPCHTA